MEAFAAYFNVLFNVTLPVVGEGKAYLSLSFFCFDKAVCLAAREHQSPSANGYSLLGTTSAGESTILVQTSMKV